MKINKIDLVNKIMILQIGWILFWGIAYSYYPQIAFLSYFPDLLNVVLIVCAFDRIKHGIKSEYLWMILFIMYVSLSILWGDMNWYYVISSFRRYATSFIIYYVASEYMITKYLKKGLDLILIALGINVFVTGYQNLVLKLHPDFCNGIFGYKTYDNAMQGIFCLLISIIAMVYFIDKKWSKYKMIYVIGSSCIVCAFAEIKAFYVLILVAFLVAFFFRCTNRQVIKNIFKFAAIGCVFLVIAYKVLERIFPANLSIFFDLSWYILYEQYGARGGAGRLTSISYIYKQVFKYNGLETLIGKGLGAVANEYAYTIGKLFVSFGVIGLLLFVGWILRLAIRRIKTLKYSSESLISFITLVMIVITLFVWNALFTQAVFFVFWILGIHNTNLCSSQGIKKKIDEMEKRNERKR